MLRMSLKELIECKHPTAWIEFEKGMIDEVQLELVTGVEKYLFKYFYYQKIPLVVKTALNYYII
jgi:hypothetical protein